MMFKFSEPYQYSGTFHSQKHDSYLVFMRGLPRSGKSSIAKRAQSNIHHFHSSPLVIICGDSFRLATHGQTYNRLAEPHVSQSVLTAIRAFLHDGYIVIFDETNSSEWSLRRIFEIDPFAQYIDVETPIETCIANNNTSKKGVPEDVFYKVKDNLLTIDPEIIRQDYL